MTTPRFRPFAVILVALVAYGSGRSPSAEAAPHAAPRANLPESPPPSALANVSGRAFVEANGSAPDALDEPAASASLSAKGADGTVLEFPLQHTRVYAQVSGNVARVEMTQLYRNPGQDRLEAVYAFPLPPNAAVTDMYFRIGNRIVNSEVKRRDEARRTYEQARSEGKTAALTEQQRPNLFTQSVANIPPGEVVAVVLRYVHEVPYDSGRYVFHVPTTIGPRYIPGPKADGTPRVPDADKITPPVVGPGYRSAHDIDITVRLSPGAAFDALASRNHRIVTGLDGDGGRLVALAEDDRVPNKDFVLSYRPAGARPRAYALVERERGDDYLMLFVQPPASIGNELVRPKEMVFLLDKSGSMQGRPIQTAIALVRQALHRMGPDDTFQIVAFDGATYPMSPSPLPNTPEGIARAEQWLGGLSGGGGTEMLQGIVAALSPPADPQRLRMVVFCTDGFIGNDEEILGAVREHRGQARVFGFGIGTSVNRYLLEGIGREGRGASDFVSLNESPEQAVNRLYARLDRPVLTDIELGFDGLEVSDVSPRYLPDLFAGQPLVIIGKYRGQGAGKVVLTGKIGVTPTVERIPLETAAAQEKNAVLGTLWARRRIDDLSSENRGSPTPDAIEAITQLGLRFKLVTAYTSFVAVERELLADPGLPLTQVIVPNELPEGVSAKGIFGESALGAEVIPNRVKPGDPELRIHAPSATSVGVRLPFEPVERQAERDPRSGDFVLRFLVPAGWPDGSYQMELTLQNADGTVERQLAPIRVDTAAPSVIATRPLRARAGDTAEVRFKPALSLSRAAQALTAGHEGGIGQALKAEMDVKEVLVRAPWGEIATARMQGALGEYVAALHVPETWPEGDAQLEIVASDTAGNVRRSAMTFRVGGLSGGERGALALLLIASGFALVRHLRTRRRIPAPIPLAAISSDAR